MGLREDALRRILSLDAPRSAQLSLRTAQQNLQAEAAAVLAVEAGRYALFSATQLAQEDLDLIAATWSSDWLTLVAGEPVIRGSSCLVPIGRPVAGLLYFGRARRALSIEALRDVVGELGDFLELALAAREQQPEAHRIYEFMLERLPFRDLAAEKLRLVLRANEWNKSRVARVLGVSRATIYKWMRKHDIAEDEERF